MKLKMLVASMALAAAGSSMAATFNLGDMGPPGIRYFGNSSTSPQASFSDTFTFTLNAGADSFGVLWDADLASRRDVSLTSLSLSGGGLSGTLTDNTPYAFTFENLLAGTYNLVVNGTVTGSTGGVLPSGYGGALVTLRSVAAPVPEPESIAMMALGLGAVGFVARRRQRKDQ